MASHIPVTIRPYDSGDAAAVADLATQLGYPATAAVIAARWATIAILPSHAVFVAVVDGRVVGYVHVGVEIAMQHDGVATVIGLVVDAAHRGQRVGEQLMAAAERWAQAAGFATMYVRSRIIREDAHRFYERLGYTKYKTSHLFTKSLDHAPEGRADG